MTRSNDAYAWGGGANVSRAYANNGLNQATVAGALSLAHDARGNLITAANGAAYAHISPESEHMPHCVPGASDPAP